MGKPITKAMYFLKPRGDGDLRDMEEMGDMAILILLDEENQPIAIRIGSHNLNVFF
jgi:hypothetical protein